MNVGTAATARQPEGAARLLLVTVHQQPTTTSKRSEAQAGLACTLGIAHSGAPIQTQCQRTRVLNDRLLHGLVVDVYLIELDLVTQLSRQLLIDGGCTRGYKAGEGGGVARVRRARGWLDKPGAASGWMAAKAAVTALPCWIAAIHSAVGQQQNCMQPRSVGAIGKDDRRPAAGLHRLTDHLARAAPLGREINHCRALAGGKIFERLCVGSDSRERQFTCATRGGAATAKPMHHAGLNDILLACSRSVAPADTRHPTAAPPPWTRLPAQCKKTSDGGSGGGATAGQRRHRLGRAWRILGIDPKRLEITQIIIPPSNPGQAAQSPRSRSCSRRWRCRRAGALPTCGVVPGCLPECRRNPLLPHQGSAAGGEHRGRRDLRL